MQHGFTSAYLYSREAELHFVKVAKTGLPRDTPRDAVMKTSPQREYRTNESAKGVSLMERSDVNFLSRGKLARLE